MWKNWVCLAYKRENGKEGFGFSHYLLGLAQKIIILNLTKANLVVGKGESFKL